MQLGVGGIEQDEPVPGKNAGVEFRERVRECFAFRITLAQVIGGQRFAQQRGSLRDEIVGSRRKTNLCHGRTRNSGGGGLEGRELEVVRQEQRLVDFVEVVVFGGQPEDGYAIDAGLLDLLGQRQRRGDLEQRHQRAAEQPHLLPGHYGKSSIAQPLNVL